MSGVLLLWYAFTQALADVAPAVNSTAPFEPGIIIKAFKRQKIVKTCSPDGIIRDIFARTVVECGSYGLPAQDEAGLPAGQLFEIVPVPGLSHADSFVQLKILGCIEIVVERCPLSQGTTWELQDHITSNEESLLCCTGCDRFRITAPAGIDSTFNILRRPEETVDGSKTTSSTTADDVDNVLNPLNADRKMATSGLHIETDPQFNEAQAASVGNEAASCVEAPADGIHAVGRSSVAVKTSEQVLPGYAAANDVVPQGQADAHSPAQHLQHGPCVSSSQPQVTSSQHMNASPRVSESQWRAMGFESEEQARQTLGEDFFGATPQEFSTSAPQMTNATQHAQPASGNSFLDVNVAVDKMSKKCDIILADAHQNVVSVNPSNTGLKRSTPSEPTQHEDASPVKQPRYDETAQALAGSSKAHNSGKETDSCEEAPFALLWIRYNMKRPFNHGAFGVKLGQVVRGSIKLAVVSNYMIDLKWLVSACPDLANAAQVCLLHGDSQTSFHAQALQEAGFPASCKVHHHSPPLPIPYGTHHSKFFLLFYSSGVRVVIHTANLIFSDCNNKTQGLFYQDFPFRREAAGAAAGAQGASDKDKSVHTDFYNHLIAYIRALRIPAGVFTDVEQQLNRCDFSSARVALIPSIPGRHDSAVYKKFGHMRLRTILGKHKFPCHFSKASICCQFSSLGSLTQDWLHGEFLSSLSAGKVAGGPGGSDRKILSPDDNLGPPKAQDLSLVWPNADQVSNSFEGWAAGGSIPGYSHNVTKPFLQPLMAKWGGVLGPRERAMPHIKTFCRFNGNEVAWLCLASHNLSRAAWGELQKKQSVLFIRSYELGVVFLPALENHFRQHRNRWFTCTDSADIGPSTAAAGGASGTMQQAQHSSCNHLLRCPWSVIPDLPNVTATNRCSAGTGPCEDHPAKGSAQEQIGMDADPRMGQTSAVFNDCAKVGIADEVIFVAAAQPESRDVGVNDSSSSHRCSTVVPLPIPFVLPPHRHSSSDVLWKVDVDCRPGVHDNIGLLQAQAGGTKYGYNQQNVQAYFDANN